MRRSQNPLTASVLQVTLAIVNALSFTSVTRAQQSPASQAPRSPPPEGGQIPRQEENKKRTGSRERTLEFLRPRIHLGNLLRRASLSRLFRGFQLTACR